MLIDGVDDFPAKFPVNDACFLEWIPFSHAGILQFEGQLITVLPGRSACYRCVFRAPPPADSVPSSGQAGILAVVPGVIGCLQASEAIKHLLGIEDLLTDSVLAHSALTMEFRRVRVPRHADRPLCGPRATIAELQDDGPRR